MPIVLATVTLNMTSGLSADAVNNDFVFQTANLTTDIDTIENALDAFYNDNDAPAIFSIASRLSSRVSRLAGGLVYDFYDITTFLDGSPHGSPFDTRSSQLLDASSATLSLPSEAAIVLSFHADLTGVPEEVGATRPRARRRGRVFIGPLNANATTDAGLVEDQIRISVNAAGNFLKDSSGVDWRVWSRMDATTRAVVGGSVDNAFDTQRRRGIDATASSSFT